MRKTIFCCINILLLLFRSWSFCLLFWGSERTRSRWDWFVFAKFLLPFDILSLLESYFPYISSFSHQKHVAKQQQINNTNNKDNNIYHFVFVFSVLSSKEKYHLSLPSLVLSFFFFSHKKNERKNLCFLLNMYVYVHMCSEGHTTVFRFCARSCVSHIFCFVWRIAKFRNNHENINK